jgi:hypothetical protein
MKHFQFKLFFIVHKIKGDCKLRSDLSEILQSLGLADQTTLDGILIEN